MHCVVFLSISKCFVIAVFESLNCPQSEKMDLNIIQLLLKWFKYAEDAGEPKNVQELEDFSEEHQAVELLRTNEGLMNNYHNTEKIVVDHPGNNTD